MAAPIVLIVGVLCLVASLGLTFSGLVHVASARRKSAGARLASQSDAPAPAAPSAEGATVYFEQLPAMPAEPGVLLNTLWEHVTTAECQQGECGGCRLRLVEGQVRWIREPQVEIDRHTHILACSCEPVGVVRCARP
jgi:ferredoxin